MQSPIEFARKYKFPYRLVEKGQVLLFNTCPLCNSKDTFKMHVISGKWECSSCKSSGSLYDLKVKLGIVVAIDASLVAEKLSRLDDYYTEKIKKAHKDLIEDKKLLEQLYNWRHYTEEAVKHFELGHTVSIDSDGNKTEYLVYPLKFNGSYYNAQFRTWIGYKKEFSRIPGASTILMNADCLLDRPREVVIAEGVVDTVSIWSAGINNVVGIITGAKSTIPSFFVQLLEEVEKITIVFDGDEAGRAGARKLAKQLGMHRCYIADPGDGLDATDYIKLYGYEKFKSLIDNARPVQVGDVESFTDIVERLSVLPDIDNILSTGFKNLDEVVGGYNPDGFLVTLASPPKSGKTTFSAALTINFAREHGPALFFCLEMEKEKIASILCSQILLSSRKVSNVDAGIVKLNKPDLPIYQAFMGSADVENVVETIREAFYRFGVRFIVFDNVHYLVRGVDNKASVLADIIKEFSLLARELGLIILLIAQPKKIPRRHGQELEMTGSDLAWSSAFETDSDLVLIINRPRVYNKKRTFSPIFKVIGEATRFASGGVCYFYLDEFSAGVFPLVGSDIDEFGSKVDRIYNEGEKKCTKR